MAYNTRRGGAGGYMTASAASVGQRRPNQHQQQQQQLGNNFVPGGQLNQPNKPVVQMPGQQQAMQRQQAQQQKPPQQQQNMPQRPHQVQQQNLRQQAQQFLAQQQPQQQAPPQAQQQPPPQAQQQPPAQVQQQQTEQAKIVFKAEEKPAGAAVPAGQPAAMDSTNGNEVAGGESEDGSDKRFRKNKPFWMRKEGKINKKERLRRRNQRLRKILQPKNALMVLNELIGSAPYNMTENADSYDGTVFKCAVLVDGQEHIGVGKSKPSAKTAAAEAALKHMVLSKLKNAQSFEPSAIAAAAAAAAAATSAVPPPADGAAAAAAADADGDIKMEIDGEDNLGGISWSHVACYALHKLLSSWDEGSNLAEKLARSIAGAPATVSAPSVTVSDNSTGKMTNENFKPLLQLAQAVSGGSINTSSEQPKTFEKKPAKKLPESAAAMNPIMLLNQMHPNAVYDEVSKTGNPPNVQFTVKCVVDGETFLGRGSTKKGARKMCAFAACKKLLGIQYPPTFLEEHGFSEESVTYAGAGAPAPPMQTA